MEAVTVVAARELSWDAGDTTTLAAGGSPILAENQRNI